MSITAKQLAAKLGLSESAISLALNDKPGVSRETRRRVIEAAKAYGYDFSKKASAGTGRKGTICFAIYKKSGAVVSDTPFFSTLTDGISMGCRRQHYDCVVRYLYEDDDIADQVYTLGASQFSGIILLATEIDEGTLKGFNRLGIPMVVLDAYYEKLDFNFILINNVQGAYMATEHLIKKRRTQPGYLRSDYWISNFEQRADGFYKAIRAAGMSTAKSQVLRLTPSQEGAYADMKRLLNAGERPVNCYFADNDLIAIGAILALKEAGYRVPEDVAVVGFDDMPACEYMDPQLTTIMVPKLFMGETAAMRVIQLIEGANTQPLKIEVSTKLVRRRSV
ncbi:MAG: LacI family DNA-binding transcriptional regulator [Clostridia bacterium]|nr:LacI family DNA-binding transcriptional regulator [Clostridia bacterium]